MKKIPPEKPSYRRVLQSLRELARPEKAEFLPGFFQAYPGGYGEGDKFIGVVVPDQRRVARSFADVSRTEISKLLKSPWHECRLTGLFILVGQFEKSRSPKTLNESEQKDIVDFYLSHLDRVNNWDLVDASAHKILGQWLLINPKQRKLLKKLAQSDSLWEQRVAVIATLPLIHQGEFDEIMELAGQFLTHPHDLMHKAVGWMLREVGKQDIRILRSFLTENHQDMPRTMLRYAIEKLPEKERQHWLGRKDK